MEEDIKIVEELINASKEYNQYEGNIYYKAIENLIARNKELEETLEEWINGERISTVYSIPKSKVQEKIEDLEKRGYFEEANAMQELLEES